MRLDRFLSEMGAASRSEIRSLCRKGQVTVNGRAERDPGCRVDPESDEITCCGELIPYALFEYYMLNKPAGVVTAVSDSASSTVMDLIAGRKRKDLFPVGRLDKDTEGLLLITNDGKLCRRLLAPGRHVPKTYFARVYGEVKEEYVCQFAGGIDIGDDTPTAPADLRILESGDESEILLTITEGRFHQVKRMFHAVGCEVFYLKRLSMGSLSLDPQLALGSFRRLTEEELRELRTCVQMPER